MFRPEIRFSGSGDGERADPAKEGGFPFILAFCNDNIVYYFGIHTYYCFPFSVGGNGVFNASASGGEGTVH